MRVLRVLEDEAELGGCQPPVDRHRDRAQVVGGEDRREELDVVVREQPDDVARAMPRAVKPPASAPTHSAISP